MAENTIAQAYVQILPTTDNIQSNLTAALAGPMEQSGQAVGSSLGGGIAKGLGTVGKIAGTAFAAVGAVTAAGTAATGALLSGVGSLAEYGDNIDKMSQKMGLSVEAYQEWDAVMQHSGTSMEAMKASMKTLANAAESGSDAFEALGISQEQIASMSQEQLFEATISALQNVEDETQRTYLAGKTLGRGATELGALLNTSAEDTQAMRDRVRELGGVMSEDAVKAAAAYQDSLQDMQTAFQGISRGLMSEFLSSIKGIMDGLTEIFNGNSEEGIGMITTGINDMMANITEMLPEMATVATSIITAIAQAFIENLPQIVSSGISIIGTLAGSVLDSLPTIIDAFIDVGATVIDTIKTYGPDLLQRGWEMIKSTAQGVIDHLPEIAKSAGEMVADFLKTIGEHLPDILDKGIEILGNIATGLIEGIPKAVGMIPELFAQFSSGFDDIDWASLGSNIIEGIKNGISNAASGLASAALGAIQTAWNGMTHWLDIRSPSKKARDVIGKNWALGIGEGFEENMPTLDMTTATARTMTAIGSTISSDRTPTAAGRQRVVVQIPLTIDGRKFANAEAEFMLDALGRLQIRNERMKGVATA